jgi:FHA domain-containing protein
MDAPKPPSGRDIWHAIKSEFEANLYELPSCVLPPSIYHVYLHSADYAIVEGIVPRIVQESANALTLEVSRRNDEATRRSGRFWRRFQSNPETMLIEVPAGGWKVRIEPDQDGELQRGRVGVLSTLMMPSAPEYSGTPTVRTVRSVFQDGQRTSTSVELDTASSVRAGAAGPGFGAILRYQDDTGAHEFTLKPRTKIGRGGMDTWVDLQLVCDARVSREHCWIDRRDDGRLMVQDVSAAGTAINGVALPAATRSAAGQVTAPGLAREVKSGDRIELAGVLTMVLHLEPQP